MNSASASRELTNVFIFDCHNKASIIHLGDHFFDMQNQVVLKRVFEC